MPTNQRWSNFQTLKGWTIESTNGPDRVRIAHLKRHPRHCGYIPMSEVTKLSESETETYGCLNDRLHEELTRVSKEHFAETPVPPEWGLDKTDWLASVFTPFTYQNTDWYGPTYECYIVVLTDYISADLLGRFQGLLCGDFQNWCIQVVGSEERNFDNDHEMAVFSDQIIMRRSAAKAIGAPSVGR